MLSSTISKTSSAEIRILPQWGALMALSLLSVPPLVAGLSGQGVARVISLAIGLTWLTLLPVTLFSQRLTTVALPVVGAASFIVPGLPVLQLGFLRGLYLDVAPHVHDDHSRRSKAGRSVGLVPSRRFVTQM
jgi:hypothetical protein